MGLAKPRLTVIEKIAYQQPNSQPTSIDSLSSRELVNLESVYIRKLTITEEWTTVKTGWVERIACLIVRNEEGKFTQLMPTPTQREESLKKLVEMRFEGEESSWVIHPQDSFRGSPKDFPKLQLRCQSGTAQVTLHVIPG